MLRTLVALAALSCTPAASPARDVAAPAGVSAVPAAVGQEPASRPAAIADFDHGHAAWTRVLAQLVRPEGLDYAGLKRDRAGLDAYLRALEAVEPAAYGAWTEAQQLAFWVNVYNAYTVRLVLDHYPVGSIRDIESLGDGVWDSNFIPLEGAWLEGHEGPLSLNQVEHGILRKRFRDARVHAAVNCASESCPPLRAEAFTAPRLDEQLDEQARAWLADPARNRYRPETRTLQVSEIFRWFAEDFERDAGSVRAWIARFAPAEHAAWIGRGDAPRLEYLEYSWRLNDAAPH